MTARYKSRPITPVDAVQWNGINFTEVQALCPQVVRVSESGTLLNIPTAEGTAEVYISEVIMRSLGNGGFTKMDYALFHVLYEVQSL